MSGPLSIQPLTGAEVATIYEKCVEILSGHGVKVDQPSAFGWLREAGCEVDEATRMVRMPARRHRGRPETVPRRFRRQGR